MWRSLVAMLFRVTAALRPGWRKAFRRGETHEVQVGPEVCVAFTKPPPVPQTLPAEWKHAAEQVRPDPEFVGRTVGDAIGNRGEAVALVVGGMGVRESAYLVSVKRAATRESSESDVSA